MAININRDLAQWLYDRVIEGAPENEVRNSLLETGYDRVHVDQLCRYAYKQSAELLEALKAYDRDAANEDGLPLPQFKATAAIPDDHGNVREDDVRVLMRSERPHVVLFGNFLSDEECEALIAMAQDQLRRAEVVSRETGDPVIDHRRTSDYAMFQRGANELLTRIEERIERVTGVNATHGEGIQVMRYGVGAEYQSHFDFFDPDGAFLRKSQDKGGQRIATLVMYLNDPPAGGETVFPDAGLSIVPRKGNAVYFAYVAENGECDNLSFHGGAPVVRGEKWIASKWLRTNPYFLDVE